MSLKFALQTLFFATLSSILIPAQVFPADMEESLFLAVDRGDTEVLNKQLVACPEDKKYNLLIENHNSSKYTPLHQAVENDNAEVVKVLLAGLSLVQKFELLTMQDYYGFTPLHVASARGYAAVAKVLLTACPENEKYELLEMGDKWSNTPLHLAAYNGNTDVVNELLSACPWNKKYTLLKITNQFGYTSLDRASVAGHADVTKALLQAYPLCKRKELLKIPSVEKLFTPQEKIALLKFPSWILPAMGVVGVAIVGYLGYRYFKKKPLPPKVKMSTQSQKTSQVLRAKRHTHTTQITL